MRILYFSQYFPPEVGATQTRAYEMARGLVEAGHQVTMIAEVPNHPTGIIPPEYQGKWSDRADLDGIDVVRVWVKTSPEKNFRTRMAFYLSFMLMAIWAGLFLVRGKYEMIYATSPPLFVGGAALVLSYLRRIPLVFEVRDLWPESAVALGELRNPWAIKLAHRLEEACYHRAEKIVLVTQEMADYLIQRHVPERKLVVIRNGANPDLFQFDPQVRQKHRKQLQLGEKFVIAYAGLLGIAQGLDIMIKAAQSLMIQEPDVHFLVIGGGPVKQTLLHQAEALNLTNITFLPPQPRHMIPGYLSAGDAALVPLTRTRLLGALPSKMFDAMACERPVLLAAEGEARQIIIDSKAGEVVTPENSNSLIEAINRLMKHPELCLQYGQNGRQAVIDHFSRQAQARQLADLVAEIEHSCQ
jgi:glycosyltransferase involved in cell wall biosynthesis